MPSADRARRPASGSTAADAPARRHPHTRARGVLHRCGAHRQRHHRLPIGRACLARQRVARCRSRSWLPGLARYARPDASGSACRSHAASQTRGCRSHLPAGGDWLRSVRLGYGSQPLCRQVAPLPHGGFRELDPLSAVSASQVRAGGSNGPWCRDTANAAG